MAELAPLAVERKFDARDEPVAAAERERDRAALDLDHFAIDLRKEPEDLIDDDAQRRRRRGLGSRGSAPSHGDEEGERENPPRVRAHADIPCSISPRLAQGVGRVKEWGSQRGMGDSAAHAPLPYDCRSTRLERQPYTRTQRVGILCISLDDLAGADWC